MRSIYLIISFIVATVFFFYIVNSFTLTINLPGTAAASPANQTVPKTGTGLNVSGTKGFAPGNFRGPVGTPGAGMIGPSANPPNY